MKTKKLLSALVFLGIALPLAGCNTFAPIPTTGISCNVPSEMTIGDTVDLVVTVTPTDAEEKNYTIKSSDENILKIEDLKLTAVGAGTASVTLTSAFAGLAPVSYNVTVNHIMPTSFSVDIPETITTLDTIDFNLEVVPANATFKQVEVTSSNEEVISYDVTTNKIVPINPGTATIKVEMKEINKSVEYPITVVQGYEAQRTLGELRTFVDAHKDIWFKEFSGATRTTTEKHFLTGSETIETTTRAYKFADEGMSLTTTTKSGETETKKYQFHAIKDDVYYNLISNESVTKKTISSYVEYPNFEISKEDALKNIYSGNILADLVARLNDNSFVLSFDAANFKSTTNTAGDFTINLTAEDKNPTTPMKHAIEISVSKLGKLLSAKTYVSKFATPEGNDYFTKLESTYENVYTFENKEKYTVAQLDNSDINMYYVKSYDVTYQPWSGRPENVAYVGESLYKSSKNVNFTNVVPATAANLDDLTILVYGDCEGVYDRSKNTFIGEGKVKLKVKPNQQIASPEVEKFIEIQVKYKEPTSFDNASLEGGLKTLTVGDSARISAKILPAAAKQAFTAETTSDKIELSGNPTEGYTVKAIAATGENEKAIITLKALADETITTTIELTIEKENATVDETKPYGIFTGNFNKYITTKIILNKDGTGLFYGDFQLRYNFKFTYTADGEIKADCTPIAGEEYYEGGIYTWTFDKNNQTIKGSINNLDGSLNFETSRRKAAPFTGDHMAKCENGNNITIKVFENYTGSIIEADAGEIFTFEFDYNALRGKLNVVYKAAKPSGYLAFTDTWTYDASKNSLSGKLVFEYDGTKYDKKFETVPSIAGEYEGTMAGVSGKLKLVINDDYTGYFQLNAPGKLSFKFLYLTKYSRLNCSAWKQDNEGFLYGTGNMFFDYDGATKTITGNIKVDMDGGYEDRAVNLTLVK